MASLLSNTGFVDFSRCSITLLLCCLLRKLPRVRFSVCCALLLSCLASLFSFSGCVSAVPDVPLNDVTGFYYGHLREGREKSRGVPPPGLFHPLTSRGCPAPNLWAQFRGSPREMNHSALLGFQSGLDLIRNLAGLVWLSTGFAFVFSFLWVPVWLLTAVGGLLLPGCAYSLRVTESVLGSLHVREVDV